ncbi:MAG: DMT family transporter [Candidatus Dormibacteria bacterium]
MFYVLVLTAVTAVWGWTFVVIKDSIAQYPVAPFLALRFGLAVLVLLLLSRRLPERRSLLIGGVIGVAVAAGYALQTYGLASTAPGTAGLITGLFVVFTPVIDRAFGARIAPRTWVAVLIALAGTGLLAGGDPTVQVGIGDLLVLLGAICFALQVVMLSRRAPGLRALDLALMQMAVCWVVFGAAGSTSFSSPTGGVWFGVVVTGVFASALAFPLQAWVQARLDATRAALIMAMEPAWALFFAVLLAGQHLDAVQAAGAAMVLIAVVGHEAAPQLAAARQGPGWAAGKPAGPELSRPGALARRRPRRGPGR